MWNLFKSDIVHFSFPLDVLDISLILFPPGFFPPIHKPIDFNTREGPVQCFFGLFDALFLCLLPCYSLSILGGHSITKEKNFDQHCPWFSYGHSF